MDRISVGLVLVGYGNRGRTYADYLRQEGVAAGGRVLAVVEPNEFRRQAALAAFALSAEAGFGTWGEFVAAFREREAWRERLRAAIVATPDHLHYGITMEAVRDLGLHVLLEKPVAQSFWECLDIARAAREGERVVGVCHPLRYHPFFVKFRELMRDGERMGRVVAIDYAEHVGLERMTHAFVRGLWRNRAASNTLLVSKSCHDVDYLVWLVGSEAEEVQTRGGLSLFRPAGAPAANEGAERCLDCPMERECPYSAVELYVRRRRWLRHFDLPEGFGEEELRRLLRETRYGRCVYRVGDNDVWDHQTLLVAFRNGVSARLSVNGVTAEEGRRLHVMGSRGELWGDEHTIRYRAYRTSASAARGTRAVEEWHFAALADAPGHAGADYALVEDFLEAIGRGRVPLCDIRHSVEAYRIAFLEV